MHKDKFPRMLDIGDRATGYKHKPIDHASSISEKKARKVIR